MHVHLTVPISIDMKLDNDKIPQFHISTTITGGFYVNMCADGYTCHILYQLGLDG
jgi:hypothetical protein